MMDSVDAGLLTFSQYGNRIKLKDDRYIWGIPYEKALMSNTSEALFRFTVKNWVFIERDSANVLRPRIKKLLEQKNQEPIAFDALPVRTLAQNSSSGN